MTHAVRRLSIIALAGCVLAFPLGSEARDLVQKDQGMDTRLFRPAVDTKGHFTIDSTPVLPHLSVSLSLMLDFAFNQWVAVEQDGTDAYDNTTVNRYITTQLAINLGLFDRLAVGLNLPLIIPAGDMYETDPADGNDRRGWSSPGKFGDLSIHAKMHITRANLHLIGVGLLAEYAAPTGYSEQLTGDPGGGTLGGKLIVDVEPARWYRAALNVGARYTFGYEERNYLNWDGAATNLFDYGPMLLAGVGQSFVLWPDLMDFVLEIYMSQLATRFDEGGYTSLEVNGGFKVYVEENSYLMAGYAHGIPLGATDSGYGFQSVEHRVFLGFAFEPSMPDRDGDGIPDAEDGCPDDKEDRDSFEDSDGCPDPDNDKDGIPDTEDSCPLVPEDMDKDRDEDGCPEEALDPDGDKDMDRIINSKDKCPEKPETYNGREDEDGCPDEGDVIVTDGVIKTLKKVYFEYNSDKIKKESFEILDAVASTIKSYPQINLIEIQGHADERGNERYNLNLTTKRAAAVKRYMIKKGVEAKRLRSMGYGEYCPIKLGHEEEDWEENRRVEVKVLKMNGKPTGVETGCQRAQRKGIVSPPVK
ncbi:MAG: OmpA family protein [Proteobacteria bacterium]|jgi:outer membrane protein OmpA-like peptidoglycan-associated protein|nr:OmpA family protein [Pseudomonadota bacterium]